MGGANKLHAPRKGSLQFWPRKRSKRSYANIRNWFLTNKTNLSGFIGYKVSMAHLIAKDTNPDSPTKNTTISIPVTILDCPPLKPLAIRFYKKTIEGLVAISDYFSPKIDKEVKRRAKLPKKTKEIPKEFDELRLIVHTQPKLTTIGKKKPEILEIPISGPKDKQLEFAKSILGKEIKLSDVFSENQMLDLHSVTKGKGFQGTVKRYGVAIRQHKSEKTKRGTGNLGAWTPKRVQYQVAQPGKMGYHQRTEYNKQLIKIGNKLERAGGFKNYGVIKNDYAIIKGSVAGARKRTIILSIAQRKSHSQKLEFNKLIL